MLPSGINFVFGGLANKGEMPFFYIVPIITDCLHLRLNWYITTFQNTTILYSLDWFLS